jgi:hypothetical protein
MTKKEAIEKIIAQAKEDAGTVEVPRNSNRGKRVEAMLANTGLDGGYPWCAAAVVTWGLEGLGKAFPVPRTADCDAILSWARRKGVLSRTPQAGDIFLVMKSTNDAIHTGIVSKVLGDGKVETWEGNTNDGGSRDGYGVFKRVRNINQRNPLSFVHWAETLDTSEEVPIPAVIKPKYNVQVHGGTFARTMLVDSDGDGSADTCVPIKDFTVALLGISADESPVAWDDKEHRVEINDVPVKGVVIKDGTAWAGVKTIAGMLGYKTLVSGTVVTFEKVDSMGDAGATAAKA